MSSTMAELRASRAQEITMQIDGLTQKQSRGQLSPLEIQRLDSLHLELAKLKTFEIEAITTQISELKEKEYRQPLSRVEAETLHKLQLELLAKNFAAYQTLQQNLIMRLSSLAIEQNSKSTHFDNDAAKQLLKASLAEKIQQFSSVWQKSEPMTGNEYEATSSQEHTDTPNETLYKP